MKSLLVGFILCVSCSGQFITPLKRHTEPPIHEESCRDHVDRLRRDLLIITDPHRLLAKRDKKYAQMLRKQIEYLQPNPDTCTHKELARLDAVESLLIMQGFPPQSPIKN
jgi:hypothetical protein